MKERKMNLVYLWVESYKCLKKQSFKFSSKYQVAFDPKLMKVTVENNDNYIDDIVYGKNIEVTAIVGENGAGKSTVLDLIRGILFDKDNMEKEAKGFLLWKSKNKLFIHSFLGQSIEYDSQFIKARRIDINERFGLVYYADLLDLKYFNNSFNHNEDRQGHYRYFQYNISTTSLLKESEDNVLRYFHNDIKKQLALYSHLKDKQGILPFPIAKSLSIDMAFLNPDMFNNVLDDRLSNYEHMGMGHHGENNTSSFTIGLLKRMAEVYEAQTMENNDPIDEVQMIEWNIFITYIYDILTQRREQRKTRKEMDDYTSVDSTLELLFEGKIPEKEEFLNCLHGVYNKAKDWRKSEFKEYVKLNKMFGEMGGKASDEGFDIVFKMPFENFNRLGPKVISNIIKNNFLRVKFGTFMSEDKKGIEEIEVEYLKSKGLGGSIEENYFFKFFSQYEVVAKNIDFLDFNWGMSSGECNLFNLFSRFYEVMENKIKRKELKEVIFILDELDCTYHPRWQQMILKSLTQFIREKYSEIDFQVIITTHSPVILSDIPKSNIVFIKKGNKETKVTEHEQTFAANIATLYYDSFFMDNGSIGEVSRGCIENLMDAMSNNIERKIGDKEYIYEVFNDFLIKQFSKEDHSEYSIEKASRKIKRLIESVGEDIWRYTLEREFNRIKGDDKEEKILAYINELRVEQGEEAVGKLIRRISLNDLN